MPSSVINHTINDFCLISFSWSLLVHLTSSFLHHSMMHSWQTISFSPGFASLFFSLIIENKLMWSLFHIFQENRIRRIVIFFLSACIDTEGKTGFHCIIVAENYGSNCGDHWLKQQERKHEKVCPTNSDYERFVATYSFTLHPPFLRRKSRPIEKCLSFFFSLIWTNEIFSR